MEATMHWTSISFQVSLLSYTNFTLWKSYRAYSFIERGMRCSTWSVLRLHCTEALTWCDVWWCSINDWRNSIIALCVTKSSSSNTFDSNLSFPFFTSNAWNRAHPRRSMRQPNRCQVLGSKLTFNFDYTSTFDQSQSSS